MTWTKGSLDVAWAFENSQSKSRNHLKAPTRHVHKWPRLAKNFSVDDQAADGLARSWGASQTLRLNLMNQWLRRVMSYKSHTLHVSSWKPFLTFLDSPEQVSDFHQVHTMALELTTLCCTLQILFAFPWGRDYPPVPLTHSVATWFTERVFPSYSIPLPLSVQEQLCRCTIHAVTTMPKALCVVWCTDAAILKCSSLFWTWSSLSSDEVAIPACA
jgi:hypothetical protein